MRTLLATLLALAAVAPAPAHALCSGETVEREFREADIVIRARLVGRVDTWSDEPDAAYLKRWGDGGLNTLYTLRPSLIYKGAPGARVSIFMPHNSGAFYVDTDKDYLLFLSYIEPGPDRPGAAAGAMTVRYACGQSKLWSEVKAADLARLEKLSAPRRAR